MTNQRTNHLLDQPYCFSLETIDNDHFTADVINAFILFNLFKEGNIKRFAVLFVTHIFSNKMTS